MTDKTVLPWIYSCALAGADLLLDVNADGVIAAAGGTPGRLDRLAQKLVGTRLEEAFYPTTRTQTARALADAKPGVRAGPLATLFHFDGAYVQATISAFKLPDTDRTGVTVSFAGAGRAATARPAGPESALPPAAKTAADDFARLAAETATALEMLILDVEGLWSAASTTDAFDSAEAALAHATGVVRRQSLDGRAAVALGLEKFALVREVDDDVRSVALRVQSLIEAALGAEVRVRAETERLPTDHEEALKVIRSAIDAHLSKGARSAGLPAKIVATVKRAGEFRTAVREGRFAIHYQPIVAIRTGSVHHYECLVRFPSSQDSFGLVRLAEELDMIAELDEAVLRKAVAALRRDRSGALKLAVNLSPVSIASPVFRAAIDHVLSPDVASRLAVELTESAAVQDQAVARRFLEGLRRGGVQVYLDDFGVGYAPMDYLTRIPFDALKLDGSYVNEMASNPATLATVRNLVKLCRELGKRTVAEQVETEATHALVAEVGFDYGQGWWYGRPAARPEPPEARSDARSTAA